MKKAVTVKTKTLTVPQSIRSLESTRYLLP